MSPSRPMVKVCGMRALDNIQRIAQLPIDLMGFIFYAPSSRYVGIELKSQDLDTVLPHSIGRVGVFVDSLEVEIERAVDQLGLTWVQLHGSEPISQVRRLRSRLSLPIIKAIGISSRSDIETALRYAEDADYLLLDTKCTSHGGSGVQFDWTLLEHYTATTPFFLSGGIGSQDASLVRSLQHPALKGIDLNSKFESEPAHKDADQLALFLHEVLS